VKTVELFISTKIRIDIEETVNRAKCIRKLKVFCPKEVTIFLKIILTFKKRIKGKTSGANRDWFALRPLSHTTF
jgi:hypothetical protein